MGEPKLPPQSSGHGLVRDAVIGNSQVRVPPYGPEDLKQNIVK